MKKVRKGFTLVELLIVIVIIGILSAAMMVSSSKANAAAKASTIYSSIDAIRTSALIYQLQQGLSFKESAVTKALLKSEAECDLDEYSKKSNSDNNIKYEIVADTDEDSTVGTYVICSFSADGDKEGIAKALAGYKNIRLDDSNYTVGAFLYHNTASTKDTSLTYDTDFSYPEE